ncbi:MAG: dihydroorotase [Treponema sp.]|nr:dihydroorotase [Treponema sp.]
MKTGVRMRIVLRNFLLVDEEIEKKGTVIIENGHISSILCNDDDNTTGEIIIKGDNLTLMPAFVDLHAHFRDRGPGAPYPSELIESASLSAAAGGFGTLVCPANTKPVTDTISGAAEVKKIADNLGIIDLYPVLSLTRGMEGRELSEIVKIEKGDTQMLMLSEDGKDIINDDIFLAAMKEAGRIGVPVSCHCELPGKDEEYSVRRVIELGRRAGCHVHIAHVSTMGALGAIAEAKAAGGPGLTCEVSPHHLCLTKEDAEKLGITTFGRVNPPLASEEDRQALISAVTGEGHHSDLPNLIEAIATDHAPHSKTDKENGSPGFSCLETAFSSVYTELVLSKKMGLSRLSALMSANPARLLGLNDRGRILPGHRADLVIVDTNAEEIVNPENFLSRGKNSPFTGRKLYGKIIMTFHKGRIAFSR